MIQLHVHMMTERVAFKLTSVIKVETKEGGKVATNITKKLSNLDHQREHTCSSPAAGHRDAANTSCAAELEAHGHSTDQ